jgi:hypothetical protein
MNSSEFFTTCKVGESSYAVLSRFPKEEYKRNRIAVLAVNFMLAFSTIFLNGISIVTIRGSSQLKNKVCHFVILLQSVLDLAVGVFGIPLFISYLLFPFEDASNSCTFIILARRITRVTCALSMVTLSGMTVERYVGVLHPYYYEARFTKKRIAAYVCTFGLCILSVLIYSFRDGRAPNFTRVLMIVFFLFTLWAYVRIYLVIRRLIRCEKRPSCQSNGSRNNLKRQIIRERRNATSCFLVVICFAVLLLPSALSAVTFQHGTVDFVVYQNWSITSMILNSSANSVVFFWTKTLLRKEASKTLKSFFQ